MSQRTSLVSILKLADEVTAIKQRVDEALDMSGAVAACHEHPESRNPGLGEEDVPVIFKPLLSSCRVPMMMDVGGLDLSDIEDLNPQKVYKIQEKTMARAKKNRKIAVKALRTYNSLFDPCIAVTLVLLMPKVTMFISI